MDRRVMICECNSLEHQVIFWYDKEENELYCEPHLTTHRNFFKRLWYGLKYAFGYKSIFVAWDSTIFKEKDLRKLRTYLSSLSQMGGYFTREDVSDFLQYMKDARVYLDTNGCIEYKMAIPNIVGLENIFDHWTLINTWEE